VGHIWDAIVGFHQQENQWKSWLSLSGAFKSTKWLKIGQYLISLDCSSNWMSYHQHFWERKFQHLPVRKIYDARLEHPLVCLLAKMWRKKNAIDWASRPPGRSVLHNKPVAVMGAVLGKSGSANAQAALRGVLSRVGAVVVPDPQVLVPRASRLFDEQVNLRDEATRQEIRQLVEAVAHWCQRIQPEEHGSIASVRGSSS
jgi:hypothetical protein